MVENIDKYGVFDNTTTDWLWEGSEEELLLTLKTENKKVNSVVDITFLGNRLFKAVEHSTQENDNIIRFLRSRLLFEEYTSLYCPVKPISIYKVEGQRLVYLEVFTVLSIAGISEANRYKTRFHRGPNFRNGPVKNVSKTYRFSNFYRIPNTAGIRKQLSRYNEDREYIKGLVKNLTYVDAWDDKPRTLTRSWKDKKVRHQWEKHKKK